mgnify:CR=1 FL=1
MRDILITAGATRNPIDAMRFISANSTGQTGAWLADALGTEHDVTVLGSPEALSRCPDSVRHQTYTSTTDLMDKMRTWVLAHPFGLVIHAAAVGDYAVDPVEGKLASGQDSLTLTLRPTPKILDAIRGWSPDVKIISFKAAAPHTSMPELGAIARAQGERTDCMAVFACGLWFDRACHECRPYACEGETVPRSPTPITDSCKPHTPPPIDPDACYPYSCSMDAWDADGLVQTQTECGHSFCARCVVSVCNMTPPNTSGTCPLCRQTVSLAGLRRVRRAAVS